jgi:hypothetical protein
VIPTLIVLGLVIGRWWRLAMIVGTAGWPVLLLAGGVVRTGPELLAATGLAAINTGVGVVSHQCAIRVVRLPRHRGARKPAPTDRNAASSARFGLTRSGGVAAWGRKGGVGHSAWCQGFGRSAE